MKFYQYGNKNDPVIVMLTGSFCPAAALDYLYEPLSKDYYLVVCDYNGHHKDSPAFTTRQSEAALIAQHIKEQGISSVAMIYGQSMGSEIGLELIRQLTEAGIEVKHAMFDGAPCIRLSKPYKLFMYIKFKTMINMMCDKSTDEVIKWKFLNKFTNGDTEALRPMIESLVGVAPYLTNESIKNETECCYTFDFPKFTEEMQKRIHFLYGSEEKAYKTCHKLIEKYYPYAKMTVYEGYAHMTYSIRHTQEYLEFMNTELGFEEKAAKR